MRPVFLSLLAILFTSLVGWLVPRTTHAAAQVDFFDLTFNQIAASHRLFDIHAVVTISCHPAAGSWTRCEYRVGEHSMITVLGSTNSPYKIEVHSTASNQAQMQMVFSTIQILTELVAPDMPADARFRAIEHLLSVDRGCEVLGRSGWSVISVYEQGELRTLIENEISKC